MGVPDEDLFIFLARWVHWNSHIELISEIISVYQDHPFRIVRHTLGKARLKERFFQFADFLLFLVCLVNELGAQLFCGRDVDGVSTHNDTNIEAANPEQDSQNYQL